MFCEMRGWRSSLLLVLFSVVFGQPSPSPPPLEGSFRGMLHRMVQYIEKGLQDEGQANATVALQLGWKSADQDFGASAGTFRFPEIANDANLPRPASPDDTVLFGSGTKTVVATAIMRLIDAGKLKGDDPLWVHIDPFLLRNNATTLRGIWGPAIYNAKVLDVIRMAAGIPGFEVGNNTIDTDALEHSDKPWTIYDWLWSTGTLCNSTSSACLSCYPGNCTRYSSTSYQVAGLLIAAVTSPDGDWTDLNLRHAAFPNASRYPSLKFPDVTPQHLNTILTSPATSINPQWGTSIIHDQNPSMLGWTCGNMVGTVQDEARFLYDLLDSESPYHGIVSSSSLSEMMRLEYLSQGWGAGAIKYGAGLMTQNVSYNTSKMVLGPEDWGYAVGHGGETYGFSSCNGYIPKLKAAYSIAMNVDIDQGCAVIQCHMMQIAAQMISGEDAYLNCTKPKVKPGPPHGPGGGGPGPPGPPWHPPWAPPHVSSEHREIVV